MSSTRIILINYNGLPGELYYLVPDNGLSMLAAFLISRGYEPLILDYVTTGTVKRFFSTEVIEILKEINKLYEFAYEIKVLKKMVELKKNLFTLIKKEEARITQEIIEKIKKFKPSIVGFKLWEAFGFHGSIGMAEEIKKTFPEIITVGGGPHVDMYDTHILDFTGNFDFLVYGEGEIPLCELAEYSLGKTRLPAIPNLIYRDGKQIRKNPLEFIKNIEDLPSPVYAEEIYPSIKGNEKIKAFLLEGSRGCPNRCKFCIHPQKSGDVWRTVKPQKIVRQMEEIMTSQASNMFRLADSSPPPGLISSISEEIINKGLSVKFSSFEHVKNHLEENYKITKEAGCQAIMFGIESGSQYILDNAVGKGISVEEAKNAIKASKKAGIYTIASVIVPCPYETPETIKETLKLLLDTRPDSVTVHCAIISPYTTWWDEPEKYCFQFKDRKKTGEKLMTMIYSFLYPPILWDRFPYRLNGLGDREMLKIIHNFKEKLNKEGIHEGTHDFLATLALGTGQDIKELQCKSEKCLWCGDYEGLMEIVTQINQRINDGVKAGERERRKHQAADYD